MTEKQIAVKIWSMLNVGERNILLTMTRDKEFPPSEEKNDSLKDYNAQITRAIYSDSVDEVPNVLIGKIAKAFLKDPKFMGKDGMLNFIFNQT